MSADTVPTFNILDPAFRVVPPRSGPPLKRAGGPPVGIAVLRYQECLALLRDRRLCHDFVGGLVTAYGITSGPFADWIRTTLISTEGPTHQRLRRLVSTVFTQRRAAIGC